MKQPYGGIAMELWENPQARVDALELMASRAEVTSGDISGALASLEKLLNPDNAKRLKGRPMVRTCFVP
jgi:hypothetical protein